MNVRLSHWNMMAAPMTRMMINARSINKGLLWVISGRNHQPQYWSALACRADILPQEVSLPFHGAFDKADTRLILIKVRLAKTSKPIGGFEGPAL